MRLHTVSPDEVPRVLAFYEDTIDLFSPDSDRPGWKKGIYPIYEDLLPHAQQGDLFALVDGEDIVGAMALNCKSEDPYDLIDWGVEASRGEYLVVHTLAVLPTRQREGLGRRMMEQAIHIGRRRGMKAVRLDVLWNNYTAQHFYERCGFVRRGEMEMFYPDTGLSTFPLYEYIL